VANGTLKVNIDGSIYSFALLLFPHKLCDWIRADDYTTSANILLVRFNIIFEETIIFLRTLYTPRWTSNPRGPEPIFHPIFHPVFYPVFSASFSAPYMLHPVFHPVFYSVLHSVLHPVLLIGSIQCSTQCFIQYNHISKELAKIKELKRHVQTCMNRKCWCSIIRLQNEKSRYLKITSIELKILNFLFYYMWD